MNKAALSALSMDLKRIALGLYRGSTQSVERFKKEALARKKEIDPVTVRPSIRKILQKLDEAMEFKDSGRAAEDLLMYSTLLQNAAIFEK